MSEDAYRDRIGLLDRRAAILERRRLEEVDRIVRLETEGAEPRIVSGHRRQAARYEEMVASARAEADRLRGILQDNVVAWAGGRPALPELPPLAEVSLADERPRVDPGAPAPVTPAAKRLARARKRAARAPRLTVLATASGRAGRAALARAVHELEDWLDDVGHGDSVEIAAVHAHRLADLEPAFLHRRPAVVHVVGRPRRLEALRSPLESAGDALKVVYMSAGRSLGDAEGLAAAIPVTLGTPKGIDAEVGAAFAAIFYAALAHGHSAAAAFERAQSALAAAKMTSGEGPRMFARMAADPTRIHVVAPVARRAPAEPGEEPSRAGLRAA